MKLTIEAFEQHNTEQNTHTIVNNEFLTNSKNLKSIFKNDIQALVCEELGVDKTYLYLNADSSLTDNNLENLRSKTYRLQKGEPLAYILGYKYFWDQKLSVTQDTLIPRADTEVLIETVLGEIKHRKENLKILDLGTGSGAIALALAGELPSSMVVAVDYSDKALEVAKQNAVDNSITNVKFIQSDWYKSLQGFKFDLIVSNPPYIDNDDNDLDYNVKSYEPARALFARDNGLADIEIIVSQARQYLNKNGGMYIEHGYTQAEVVSRIYSKYGFGAIETIKDLNNKDRCTKAFLL